jgi:hypothetical protein
MIVRQFDVPKEEADTAMEAAEKAFLDLANCKDLEDTEAGGELDEAGIDDDDDVLDGEDGWCDERELLTAEEHEELNVSVRPVRLILVKVSISFITIK